MKFPHPAPKPTTRRISPLTLKILGVNIGALAMLALGFLYTAQYENQLIESELAALHQEAKLISAAISEGGVRNNFNDLQRLAPDLSQLMVRKIAAETDFRIILVGANGELLADSQRLTGAGGIVQIFELPPPAYMQPWHERAQTRLTGILEFLPTRVNLPPFPEFDVNEVQSLPNMIDTLKGANHKMAWQNENDEVLLAVSQPVARLKQVLGGIMLIRTGDRIESAIDSVQLNVIRVFLATLAITILLSLYLSTTIATPIRRLSRAADRMRVLNNPDILIPDLSARDDEIGDLSISLRDLTKNLQRRLMAIESFAADVAHELKNPLASVQSAIETLPKAQNEADRQELEKIILDDLHRLNRLISDISAASRLDAELGFENKSPIDLNALLQNLVDECRKIAPHHNFIYRNNLHTYRAIILGRESRLRQVFTNIIDNAVSFAEYGTDIRIKLDGNDHYLQIRFENDGPCIAENKLEEVFNRFYSERPKNDGGATHSGLGLSISRQIISAHSGEITAQNIIDDSGLTKGVRFIITLPRHNN